MRSLGAAQDERLSLDLEVVGSRLHRVGTVGSGQGRQQGASQGGKI